MEKVTPELITLGLNILALIALGISFLIGFCRGSHKATYRFVVSIVVILGCWTLFPLITSKLMDFNFGKYYTFNYEGVEIKTLAEGLEFATQYALGFIKPLETGGFSTYTGDVVIQETMLYGLLYGMVEMIFRIVLIMLVLILNWTLFRIIFGIIYKFIKPKKRDKFNKKKKTKGNRLIGGLIGLVNGLAIFLIICTPLSGVMSIADNAADLLSETTESGEVKLSFGTEVIELSGDNITNFSINRLKPWTSIYRNTVCGYLFQVKVSGTELDCALFDNVFSFVVNDEKVAIRAEIDTVADAAMVLKDDVIQPLVSGEDVGMEVLDNLSSAHVTAIFDELKELKVVNIVLPIGVESALYIVKNNDELITEYASVVDLLEELNNQEISLSDTIAQVGNLSSSLFELVEASGVKISELMESTSTPSSYIDALLSVDSAVVKKVFNSIADIELIDKLQDIAFVPLEDYIQNEETFKKFMILYPKVEISDDNFYVLNGVKSNVAAIEGKDLQTLNLTVNEENCWVIEGVATTIDASDSLFELSLKNIKLTDEIRNIANLYESFKGLGISSFSEIQKLIENGPNVEGSFDLDKITYEKIDKLFVDVLNFKLVSENIDNAYVIINNIVPMQFRGLIKKPEIKSEDLTSLVYAAKVVASTGVLWDMENSIKTDGELDYTKLYNIFNEVKDEVADNLVKSSLIVDNINAVAGYAIGSFMPELTLNLDCVNWKQNGADELKKLFNVVNVVLKYGNKITKDFYSLTDDELDDICETIKHNIDTSILLQNNMNSLVELVSGMDALKELGIVITPLEGAWTKEEIDSIFNTLKIVVKVMKNAEGGEGEGNLLLEILKLTEEDINEVLKSKFIVKNLAYNLVSMSQEGGALYQKVIVNLDKDSELWYDEVVNGEIIRTGELRIILMNAIKLINGVEGFEDTDLLITQIIKNISNLSNNFKGNDDEVGELLQSMIISDTLIYHIKNIDGYMPEDTKGLIVINDDIVWKDTETKPGELRVILKAITDILIDEEGNVILSKLTEGTTEDIIGLFFGISDEKVDDVLASNIVLDTIVKFVIEFSEPTDDRTFVIFLKDKDKTDDEWRSELKNVIRGAKVVLLDKDGKLIDLNGSEETYINLIADITDEKLPDVLSSEILVDTIANLLIGMADEENALFAISDNYRGEPWTDALTLKWKAELERIIKAAKVVLFDENGNSVYNDLIGNDNNKKIEIIANLKDEDVEVLVASDILVDTIANLLIGMADEENSLFAISDNYRGEPWTDALTLKWKAELERIIKAAKVVLFDENGNSVYNDLIGNDNNKKLEIIIDISNEDVEVLVASDILVDTIAKVIIEMSEGENPLITLKDDIKAYDTILWREELKKIISSAKLLLVRENQEGEKEFIIDKLSSGSTEDILDIVLDIKDEDIDEILNSKVIVDTISQILIDLSNEENSIIQISDAVKAYDRNQWATEINALIKSAKGLLTTVDGDGNTVKLTDKLLSEETEDILDLITELEDEEIDDVIGSRIIVEVISNMLIDMSEENGVIVVSEKVKQYTFEEWKVEVKNIIISAKALLIDSEGNSNASKLLSGDENDMLLLIIEIGDDDYKIEKVLQSEVIYDTIKTKVKDLGDTDPSSDSVIIIPADIDNWSKAEWKSELKSIICACEYIVVEYDGDKKVVNLDKIKGDKDNLMLTIAELSHDEVEKVLESKILYLTLTTQVKNLANEEGTVIVMPEGIDSWQKDKWIEEVKAIVDSINILFIEEVAGQKTVNLDKLNTDVNELLQIIVDLSDDTYVGGSLVEGELTKILKSDIIVCTIAKQIEEQGAGPNPTIITTGTIGYTIDEWRVEIKSLIAACDKVLVDGEGNVDIENITSNANDLIDNVLDLNNDPNGENDELGEVLSSVIISDTIVDMLEKESKSNGGTLYIESNVVWKDVIESGTITQTGELRNLLVAIQTIYKDSSIDLNNIDANELLNKIKVLNNNINNEDDEICLVLASRIIALTAVDVIIAESGEGKSLLCSYTINSPEWFDQGPDGYKTAGELRKIFKAIPVIFEDNVDVSTIGANIVLGLEDDEIDILLDSKVLYDTVEKNIEDLDGNNGVVVSEEALVDLNTEVKYLIKAANIILADEHGNVDLDNPNFDINVLKTISDGQLNTVFSSIIIVDTFYSELDKLSTGSDPVLFIKPGMNKDADEAKRFVKSVREVLGDQDINDMDSSEFNFDKFISKDDGQIETILSSTIIKYSAAKKVLPVLTDMSTSVSLGNYIKLKSNSGTEEQKLEEISNDLANILKAIRDLNNLGISYESISFDSILNYINNGYGEDTGTSEKAKTDRADNVADALLQSDIIDNSIETMLSKVLAQSLDDEMMDAIKLENEDGSRMKWRDTVSNGEIVEVGEFKKIFRLMVHIEQFTDENSLASNSAITDKDQLTKPLLAVNDSKVLCGVIPMFVDKALENVRTWEYQPGDPLYKETLTKEEWDEEIVVIATIVELVNNEESFENLGALDVKDEDFHIESFGNLMKEIAKSRKLNIAKVEEFVKKAVDETFDMSTTVASVYTGNVHEDKVEAWNKEDGEIDALMLAVKNLRRVNPEELNLLDKTVINTTVDGKAFTKKGVLNAYLVGTFLDSCRESIMLDSVVEDVFNKLVGGTPIADSLDINTIDSFAVSLVNVVTILTMF